MILKIISLPIAILKDACTLGGAINDAHFTNDGRSYTGKKLKDIAEEIELNDAIKKLQKLKNAGIITDEQYKKVFTR
jgi:hypothetical protein